MPQIFQVLRCYKCLVFQIHQTKKSNRWECKLCGEKQSVKRHYGIGNGKECRMHVQRLNRLRGEKDENKIIESNTDDDNESNTDDDNESENYDDIVNANNFKGKFANNKSKWIGYMETPEEPQESDTTETMYLDGKEVVLEVPKKRKKNICYSQNKIAKAAVLKTIDRSKTLKDDFKTNVLCNDHLKSDSPSLDEDSVVDSVITKPIIQNKETSVPKMPPAINKNSKWAQYTNEEPIDEKVPSKVPSMFPTEVIKQSIPKGIFSLFEDGDLDNVLDI